MRKELWLWNTVDVCFQPLSIGERTIKSTLGWLARSCIKSGRKVSWRVLNMFIQLSFDDMSLGGSVYYRYSKLFGTIVVNRFRYSENLLSSPHWWFIGKKVPLIWMYNSFKELTIPPFSKSETFSSLSQSCDSVWSKRNPISWVPQYSFFSLLLIVDDNRLNCDISVEAEASEIMGTLSAHCPSNNCSRAHILSTFSTIWFSQDGLIRIEIFSP